MALRKSLYINYWEDNCLDLFGVWSLTGFRLEKLFWDCSGRFDWWVWGSDLFFLFQFHRLVFGIVRFLSHKIELVSAYVVSVCVPTHCTNFIVIEEAEAIPAFRVRKIIRFHASTKVMPLLVLSAWISFELPKWTSTWESTMGPFVIHRKRNSAVITVMANFQSTSTGNKSITG